VPGGRALPRQGTRGEWREDGEGSGDQKGTPQRLLQPLRELMLLDGKAGLTRGAILQSPGGQRGDLFPTCLIFLYL